METTETARRARKDVQAKDISDRLALDTIRTHATGVEAAWPLAALADVLKDYPPKVVAAKLRALFRRGLVVESSGSVLTLTEAGLDLLRS